MKIYLQFKVTKTNCVGTSLAHTKKTNLPWTPTVSNYH